MGKKKKNEEGEQPLFPSQPTEDLTGAFPAEGFETGAYPTEGFGAQGGMPGDLGQPTEGFTSSGKMPTGAHGWTEGMSGDHGILPTEGFPGGAGPRPAARPGGRELEELDDVLVLLPEEEDEAPTHLHTGEVIRNPIGADVTIRATTSHLRGSESPTGIEDVQLLAQHPDHGVLPVEDYHGMGTMDQLPDIEDVEDITSLVEEAVASDLPSRRADFENEYVVAPHVARSRGGFSAFVRIAAAAAIIVAGTLYGPDLYDQAMSKGTKTVAGNQGSSGGTGTVPGTTTGTSTSTGTTTVTSGSTGAPASVAFRGWVDGVLAAHFGTAVPTQR